MAQSLAEAGNLRRQDGLLPPRRMLSCNPRWSALIDDIYAIYQNTKKFVAVFFAQKYYV